MKYRSHRTPMQIIEQHGALMVVKQTLRYYTEYQVRWGRRIVSRHPTFGQANLDAKIRAETMTALGTPMRKRQEQMT